MKEQLLVRPWSIMFDIVPERFGADVFHQGDAADVGQNTKRISGGIVVRQAVRVAALISLGLVLIGCGGHSPQPSLDLGTVAIWNVLSCEPWPEAIRKRSGVVESQVSTRGFENISVVVHMMMASIGRERKEYKIDQAWMLAPIDRAVEMELSNVMPGNKDTKIAFWTPEMIKKFFSRDEEKDGLVNQILWEAFFGRDGTAGWKGHGIRLILRGGEYCKYSPRALRPDGLVRDSILSPQTSTPWTSQFFWSVNRLFANENPHVLHVLLWWSVSEGDIDGINAVSGGEEGGGNKIWGYSRSAARGGPAVWLGTYNCLRHPRLAPPPSPTPPITFFHGRCAKVIAHEVGHALGLHHIEKADKNLMYVNPPDKYISEKDKGVELSVAQKEELLRESQEQFGSR